MKTTKIYRAVVLELERRRRSLGLPLEKFGEYAGLPDRYVSKAVHSDTPSGRQAQWSTLEIWVDSLFPAGYDLIIKAKPGQVISADNLKAKLLRLTAINDPKTQREVMAELGRLGGKRSGESRLRKVPRWKRKLIARRAARQRWRMQKAAEKSARMAQK